jgi:DNA-binding NarL/FixJ family response regulator
MNARVVIANRNVLIRDLLRLVFARHGIHVVGETSSAAALVELARDEMPDVIVTDAQLDEATIEECLDRLIASSARVIVLCDDPSPERLTRILGNGASGYLLHDSAPEQVAEAVLAVSRGAAALDPTAAGLILQQWRRLRGDNAPVGPNVRAALTPRETDVLAAMSDGLATKAIARRLGVAVKTVENHKIRIFDKLGVRTQAHAVTLAIGHGLLADLRDCTVAVREPAVAAVE